MPLPSSNAVQAIITKGLSCGQTTGCQGGTLITAGPFSLYCENPITFGGGGGGGPVSDYVVRPLQPGEIANLYQPLPDTQQYYVVPRDQEAQYFKRFIPVKIEIKVNKFEIERQYMVPQTKARVLFNTINVINVTRERIKTKLNSIKKVISSITVKLTSWRVKPPKQ